VSENNLTHREKARGAAGGETIERVRGRGVETVGGGGGAGEVGRGGRVSARGGSEGGRFSPRLAAKTDDGGEIGGRGKYGWSFEKRSVGGSVSGDATSRERDEDGVVYETGVGRRGEESRDGGERDGEKFGGVCGSTETRGDGGDCFHGRRGRGVGGSFLVEEK